MTSQTSMSIRWHISAISFTRPMLTARNVFSSSFTISATRVLSTLMTRSTTRPYSAAASSVLAWSMPPTTFGMFFVEVRLVARIDALGRERQVEIAAHLQAARFERGLRDLFGRPGIGGRFQNHELSLAQDSRGRFDGFHDIRQVRVAGLAQRRRHADVDDVDIGKLTLIGRRAEGPRFDDRGQLF